MTPHSVSALTFDGGNRRVVGGTVGLTQRTLAAMLGVQRPSLNKILEDLESGGLITVAYGTIRIKNPGELAQRAASTTEVR